MGARESNAGDDFHFLWAARRAVNLLDTSSTLTLLTVEKLAESDNDDSDLRLLTADVVEYHGGRDYASADRVDMIQLKYSTKAPQRAWTAARLTEKAGIGQANKSLVKRLSDAVNHAEQKMGANRARRSFRVKLVSNQPVSVELERAVAAGKNAGSAYTKKRLSCLDPADATVLEKLYSASGQGSRTFALFLDCLDLSGCGGSPRRTLRHQLSGALGGSAPVNPSRAASDLVDLMRSEALPEGRASKGVDRERVLAALGASSFEMLFPAPPRFEKLEKPISTDDSRRVAKAIEETSTRQVVIHGDAGVGKTTTGQLMREHLPSESVLIAFDCFGSGDYLNAGAQRHTVRRALRQLINDLALECGTPFLVVDQMDIPDLERYFVSAWHHAASAVGARGGLLVLLIDAADNATRAGRIDGDCVIPRLWAAEVPEAGRMVMSTRTHRLSEIAPPKGTPEVLLKGFNIEASTLNLQQEHCNANSSQGQLFHSNTQGNPRVQRYVLASSNELSKVLDTSELTPKELFTDIYNAAVQHADRPELALDHAAALIALIRPGGFTVFAAVEGFSLANAEIFCRGLVPGVRVEGTSEDGTIRIEFKDEDFETFVTEHVGSIRIKEAHSRYAEWCLANESKKPYAARAIADHLHEAERYEELLEFALQDSIPKVINDDVARLEIRQRRARLALKAAKSPLDGTRVVLLLAEVARERGGFAGLVEQAPGLAVRYADPGSVGRLFLQKDNHAEWLGPAHFHAAAVLSGDPTAGSEARRHLAAGNAWVEEWMLRGRELGWRLNTVDIVREATAAYHLVSLESAVGLIRRWRPRKLRLDIVYGLGKALGTNRHSKPQIDLRLLGGFGAMALIAGGWSKGVKHDSHDVFVAGKALRQANLNGRRREIWKGGWAVDAAEALAHAGAEASLIRQVLHSFAPEVSSPYSLYNDFSKESGVSYLRSVALSAALDNREAQLIDFVPKELRKTVEFWDQEKGVATFSESEEVRAAREADKRRRESVSKWREQIDPILPVLNKRARVIVNSDIPGAETRQALEVAVKTWKRSQFSYSRSYGGPWMTWLIMLVDIIGLTEAKAESVQWLDETVNGLWKSSPGGSWLTMAEQASRYGTALEQAALKWIAAAVRWQTDTEAPVVDRRDLFLRAAQIALPLDEGYGRDLYLQALQIASELDDEGTVLLSAQARLVSSTAASFDRAEARALAVRLPESLDALAPRVSEPDRLPFIKTILATLALSPERGLQAWARWIDSEMITANEPSSGSVSILLNHGFEPEEVLAILRATNGLTLSGITAALDKLPYGARKSQSFRRLTDTVLREEPLKVRGTLARGLVEWADKNRFADEACDRLKQVVNFTEVLDTNRWSGRVRRSAAEFESDEEINAEIESAVKAAQNLVIAGEFDKISKYWSKAIRASHRNGARDFVERVAEDVRPSDRVRFLQSLISDAASEQLERYSSNAAIGAIRAQIGQWRDSGDVRRAEAAIGQKVIAGYLPGLMGYDFSLRPALRNALAMLPPESGANAIIAAVPLHIPDLTARDLYGTFEILAEMLPLEDRYAVLSQSLARRERSTRKGGELPNHDPTEEPSNELALARFFWALFASTNRKERWRALHAAHGVLVDLPNSRAKSLFSCIIEQLDDSNGDELRQSGRFYLWHSARVVALQLVLRLTYSAPEVVAPHAKRLAEIALDRELPHVVARELARRTVLHLVEIGVSSLPLELSDEVFKTNQPNACLLGENNRECRGAYHSSYNEEDESDTFGFDTLDIVPYWFEGLEERFAVESGTVLERAKVWVIDRWGFSENTWKGKEGKSSDYTKSYARKGDIPEVETVRNYIQWHAMMCVAGELIDEGVEVVTAKYAEEGEDSWSTWLGKHLPFNRGEWFSESLSETPLEPEFWGQLLPLDEWRRPNEPGEFDAALGLKKGWQEQSLPNRLIVSASIKTNGADRYGSTSITSSLVTPNTAEALVRALLDLDSNDWRLPEEESDGDTYRSHHEIRKPGFELSGWLSEHSRYSESFSEYDPYRRDAPTKYWSPGKAMTNALGLTGGPLEWLDRKNRRAFSFMRWSDTPPASHGQQPYRSAGYRLDANLTAILEALQTTKRELLIEVMISRNVNTSQRYGNESKYEYDLGRSRLYLLRRNGTLVACEPEPGAWARDRPRPRRR